MNALDRAVDELLVYLRNTTIPLTTDNLLSRTVIMFVNDNGNNPNRKLSGKGEFEEHGYRVPIIVYDGGNPPLPSRNREDFAATIDVRRTMSRVAGVPSQCTPTAGCTACPCPQPLNSEAYEHARNMLEPNLGRACEFPPGGALHFNPEIEGSGLDPETVKTKFKQCLVGIRGNQQSVNASNQWYILAEIENPSSGRKHLCKYYRECTSNPHTLHDLTCDPTERYDLYATNAHYGSTDYCKSASGPVVMDPTGNEFCKKVDGTLLNLLWYTANQRGWTEGCFASKPYPSPP